MPSLRHQMLAWVIPRLLRSGDLDDVEAERALIEERHRGQDRSFPTRLVWAFDRRFTLEVEDVGGFPSYTLAPRGVRVQRTVLFVHGGGFMAPASPFHVRYAAKLARALSARVVMPDYPLMPEHTWRDSFPAMTDLAERLAKESDDLVLLGDSAGGGYALALAVALRDRGGAQPGRLVLHSPWGDLTTSAPETIEVAKTDPWLFLGKIRAYAQWWAGSVADLGRPEVSPALADLSGLPQALMFSGTRDALMPGCRLLARRAGEAGWDLTYIEVPDLIHVYPILPIIPEAKKAWRQTMAFLR